MSTPYWEGFIKNTNNTMTNSIPQFLSLENKIGINFPDQKLLQQAFIHRSYLNEHHGEVLFSNEKLEFLGDSVLSLITSIYLFNNYPEYNEGTYTDIKASIVRTESLAVASRELGLGQYLMLSKGERDNKGEDNTSILADCFEAFLATIFLEHDFEKAYEFVETFLFKGKLEKIVENKLYQPAKNRLQEYSQEKYKELPKYVVLSEIGPQHNKTYTVGVYYKKKELARGAGKSKKEAEENAAYIALQNL